MSVSAATAARAIKRWELDGALYVRSCGCREWFAPDARVGRLVVACERHRQVYLP